ncbi:MAG: hypothetical protein R3C27_04205 [Hyphomonadaceae bacterium]
MLKRILSVAVAGLWLAAASASGQTGPSVVLATQQEGAAAISARDEYMDAVTAGDVSIWLHQPGHARDVDALANYLAANTRPWTDAERVRLDSMLERVAPRVAALAPWLPARVQIAGFNPQASAGADFTRGSTIFLAELQTTDEAMDERFFHELFHVLSRQHPDRRDEFYAIVGFQRCTPMALDDATRARLLTNPDAPTVQYASEIDVDGQRLWATPLMLAELDRYTPQSGLFDHVDLQFVALRRDAQGRCERDAGASISQPELGGAIVAKAGGNTAYVLHPEELTADNFAQMMMGRRDAPSPEIHTRIATLLNIERPSTRE